MTPARLADIRALITDKTAMHPELRRPLGLAGFRRMLVREKVELVVRAHPRIAQLTPRLDGWAIIIDKNQPATARLLCGCHELAHLWLHHDPLFPRWETSVYDRSPMWFDEAREAEADAFAEMLVRGPEKPATSKSQPATPKRKPTAQLLLDPDGDAFAEEMWRASQAEIAARPPTPTVGPTVQFTIRRRDWDAVSLERVQQLAGTPVTYDARWSGNDYWTVTCDESSAAAIVTLLARAGHRRAAVHVRRTVRQTKSVR